MHNMQVSLEEEEIAKQDIQRQLAKNQEELEQWRIKYNDLIIHTIPPLEEENKKLAVKLHESEQIVEHQEAKVRLTRCLQINGLVGLVLPTCSVPFEIK